MTEVTKCEICGEPMPEGETMFKFHGYSGPCPKPPLLQPHQQRVVAEKAALDHKIVSLNDFIDRSPIFETLDPSEQERLARQVDHMTAYSAVLSERIAAFANTNQSAT